MVKELVGGCACLRFRTDDESRNMASAAKGWLLGIQQTVGMWSSAAGLIKQNDQQPAALEIGIVDQGTYVRIEPMVDLPQGGVIAASCLPAGFRIVMSVIVDIRNDEGVTREAAITKILSKIPGKRHEIGRLRGMVSGPVHNGGEIRKRIMAPHILTVAGRERSLLRKTLQICFPCQLVVGQHTCDVHSGDFCRVQVCQHPLGRPETGKAGVPSREHEVVVYRRMGIGVIVCGEAVFADQRIEIGQVVKIPDYVVVALVFLDHNEDVLELWNHGAGRRFRCAITVTGTDSGKQRRQ